MKDIGTVVDFILARRNIPRLNLLGWSWGTTLMATYTIAEPGQGRAAGALRAGVDPHHAVAAAAPAPARSAPIAPCGASRRWARWLTGVPEDKKAALIPPGWFDAWADATFASDPDGAKQNPPVLRAPNGVVQDGAEFWASGKPYYDPAKITVPTLLVLGEWDRDTPPYMAQTLFPLLVNSPGKRFVMLAEGTHTS